MASSMFQATYNASKEITRTLDMVWALNLGLWRLRNEASEYLDENPDTNDKKMKVEFAKGVYIHGLNFKRIGKELSWDDEEQYIAELLLINATAIFDSWVDDIVDAGFLSASNNRKKEIKKKMKEGDFSELNNELLIEPHSVLYDCFDTSGKRLDSYIDNLILVYKYFKSCRNCCAHGSRLFSNVAETNYNAISAFSKTDIGLKEMPKIAPTVHNTPLKLYLRGVVGFYDVFGKIMQHYDAVLADYKGIELDLISRWTQKSLTPIVVTKKKKENTITQHLKSINIYPPKSTRVLDVFKFLEDNKLVKLQI